MKRERSAMQVLKRKGQVGRAHSLLPRPKTTASGTQRSLGAGSAASPRPRPGRGDREGQLRPPGRGSRFDSTSLPATPPGSFSSPYSPGDPGRGAIGARGHLGRGTEGVRGSPRPGGHGGRPPQGGSSRRRPRSRAPRPGPGWGHGGGSALRRGAGRGRPADNRAGNRDKMSGPAPSPVPAPPMHASPAPPAIGDHQSLSSAPKEPARAPQPALHGKPRPAASPAPSKLHPALQVGATPATRARHCPVPALLPRAPGSGALGPWGPALVPASGRYALHLQPGVVHGRGHGRADGGRVDVADDAERLLQRVVHAQHLVAPLRLLGGLLHQRVLVPARVQVGQQLREDELLGLRTAGKGGTGLRPAACAPCPPVRPCRTACWPGFVLTRPPPDLGDTPPMAPFSAGRH